MAGLDTIFNKLNKGLGAFGVQISNVPSLGDEARLSCVQYYKLIVDLIGSFQGDHPELKDLTKAMQHVALYANDLHEIDKFFQGRRIIRSVLMKRDSNADREVLETAIGLFDQMLNEMTRFSPAVELLDHKFLPLRLK